MAGEGAADYRSKASQRAFFDEMGADDAEFETVRPHGTPDLYRWLMERKVRFGTERLQLMRAGLAFVACAGSGMDAEALAACGQRVIASDISHGAMMRTVERATRYRLPLVAVVADAERLPIADKAVDLAWVHDGLHHLPNPLEGVRELARIARYGVSVNEPAQARVTSIAVRCGLALAVEEAGNRVERLDTGDVEAVLRGAGFESVASRRYAMYYRHRPGKVVRLLSKGPLFRLAAAGYVAVNAVVGRFGNKLTVQASRSGTTP